MPLVLSVISLFLCLVFFFYFRRYIAQKTSADRFLADYRAEVYRLIAEIDAAADRDSRLVEDRVKNLRQLLEDTDKRISVYMRELERSRHGEAMYTSLGKGIRAALDSGQAVSGAPTTSLAPPESSITKSPPETPLPSEPAAAEVAGNEYRAEKERRTKKNGAKPLRETDAASGQSVSSKRKLKVRIAEMSARGFTPQEIASRLNLSLTEIDLALNLLQRPNN